MSDNPSQIGRVFGAILRALVWLFFCLLLTLLIHGVCLERDWLNLHSISSVKFQLSSEQHRAYQLLELNPLTWYIANQTDYVSDFRGYRNQVITFAQGLSWLDQYQTEIRRSLDFVFVVVARFCFRLSTLLSVAPLIGLWWLIAFNEGWTSRAIRRERGGRESAQIYHAAKRSVQPLIAWSSLFFLVPPVLIDVSYFYLPVAAASSIAIYFTASRFKKYL